MNTILLFGAFLLIIWCAVLSYLYVKLSSHYNSLTQGVHKKTLTSVLDHMGSEVVIAKRDIETLLKRCDTIEKENQFHIQKIGLLRFNPFNDTGGDQSFILSLLDSNNTGVVISGLFSRSGMRWYAKKVVQGDGQDHELSEEEKKALRIAKSTKPI
jgi:hypothetical protein